MAHVLDSLRPVDFYRRLSGVCFGPGPRVLRLAVHGLCVDVLPQSQQWSDGDLLLPETLSPPMESTLCPTKQTIEQKSP
jgi:hypothetical protein